MVRSKREAVKRLEPAVVSVASVGRFAQSDHEKVLSDKAIKVFHFIQDPDLNRCSGLLASFN
jgi:hypothetical protein